MIQINKRSIGVCILLSIITFGIYGIYWLYLLVKNTRSIQKNTTSCTGEMLCLIFVPFYSLYWWYTRGEKVKQEFSQHNYVSTGNGIVYLILAIFGLSIVSMAIMQSDFNSLKSETHSEQRSTTKMYVSIGVFSAIAFVLQVIGSMMGLKVSGFLEIEISDLPALIMAFAFGPAAGVFTELVKNLLHCTMTSTGFVGELANFVINGTFCAVAGLVYRKNTTRKGAMIALLVATLSMAVAGVLANLFIMLPLYMPTAPFNVKLNLVLFTILPFNIIRGLALSLITFLIYKKISPIIK